MNKTIIALTLSLTATVANATNTPGADCVGQHACRGAVTDNRVSHNPVANGGHQQQGQAQQQAARAGAQSDATAGSYSQSQAGVTANTNTNTNNIDNSRSKSFTVIPVQVQAQPIITPAAGISRMVGQCGPRQKVVSYPVSGVNNRTWSAEKVDLGVDQELFPDFAEPYRKVEVLPGVYQLLGHQIIETSTVITVSSSHGFGFGGNNSNGGGGSLGINGGGAMQRIVNTIRLQECVVGTIQETPVEALKRPVAPSKPKAKVVAPTRVPKASKALKCDCEKK